MENAPTAPQESTSASAGKKADLGKRFIAAIIDAAIAAVVGFIPFIGGFIGAAYILLRDGLAYDIKDHRSVGKRLMKLRPVALDGGSGRYQHFHQTQLDVRFGSNHPAPTIYPDHRQSVAFSNWCGSADHRHNGNRFSSYQ